MGVPLTVQSTSSPLPRKADLLFWPSAMDELLQAGRRRLSNQLEGKVVEVTLGDIMAYVVVHIGNP
jgi:hypothetical protein